MDERAALLALSAEPAALVDRDGAVVTANERLLLRPVADPARRRPPTTVGELLERFGAEVAGAEPLRAAVEQAVRDGATLRRLAPAIDPAGDDLEVLVVPDRWTGDGASLSLVVLRSPARRAREEVVARRHDRLALVGQLAAETAHELNNVLTAVIGWSQLLAHGSAGETPARMAERAGRVEAAALKAQRIVADLMGVARGKDERDTAAVGATAREVARMMEDELARRSVSVTVDVPRELEARIRRLRLSQVLLNLVRNAAQAIRRDGHVHVAGRAEDGWIVVRVEDDGPGMDGATLSRAFDPFFTTRKTGGDDTGTGLGLPLCRRIIEVEAGGSIRLSSVPGRGTTVELRLPLAPAAELETVDAAAAGIPPAPAEFTLLVVERDARIAEVVGEAVKRFWSVSPVIVANLDSAVQALAVRPFAVCLLDADADPLGPAAALKRLRESQDGLRIVLGISRDSWVPLGKPHSVAPAAELLKPFTIPDLLRTLDAAARSG